MNTNILPTTNVKLRPLDFAFDTTSDILNVNKNNFNGYQSKKTCDNEKLVYSPKKTTFCKQERVLSPDSESFKETENYQKQV